MTARDCPLCQKALRAVDPELESVLLQCPTCTGLWAHVEAGPRVHARHGRRHHVLLQVRKAHACRKCRRRIKQAATRCRFCGAGQTLACLDCREPMARVRVKAAVIDLCRPCRSAWLDPGELAVLVSAATDQGIAPQRREGDAGGISPVDGLDAGELVIRGGEVIVDHGPALAQVAGEGAASVVEVSGEVALTVVQGAAEGAVELVLTVVGGLLDGL
jgi:Zn-finger nucleic acid-binding protein